MTDQITPIAVRPRQAAKMLSVSERTLYSLTQPRGPIPCRRMGGTVLYSVAVLQAWLEGDESHTNATE